MENNELELKDALSVADYIEKLHSMEQSWIMNRLSWLLVSQSFFFLAYSHLITNATTSSDSKIAFLIKALPLFGIAICLSVGIAIFAAEAVATKLADQRASICSKINGLANTDIPILSGTDSYQRGVLEWTLFTGRLPHFLPWVIFLLWLILLIKF